MRTIRQWRPSVLLTALAGLLALTAALAPVTAPRAAAQSLLDLYVSDQYDYLFFFDPAIWTLEEETTSLDSDFAFFSDGDIFVYYLSYEAPGVSTRDCLGDILAELAIDTEILSIEPLLPADDGGGLDAAITSGPTSSTIHLILTIDEDGKPYKLVTEETCHQIYPDESLLYVSTNVPAEVYNDLAGHAPFATVPAIALSLPSIDGRASATTTGQVPLPTAGQSGDLEDPLTGTLEAHLHCAIDGPPQLLILTRALDFDLTLDPTAFAATPTDGEDQALVFGEWLYPDADPTAPLTLEPGEVSLAWFELPGTESPLTLTYAGSETAAPIALGQIDPAACTAPGPSFPASVDLTLD